MKKLQNYHSTAAHNFALKTHLRRLARNQGTESLAGNIKPLYQQFLEKQNALKEKMDARMEANDDIDYYDTILDNDIKIGSFEAKSYDVKSGVAPVYNILFPDGGYSTITRMNKIEEVTAVEALAGRYENLGEGNPLFSFAALLRSHVEDSKKAIQDCKTVEEESNKAEAELEVAKSNLREKYRNNYLQACTQFGENKAESLFTSNF